MVRKLILAVVILAMAAVPVSALAWDGHGGRHEFRGGHERRDVGQQQDRDQETGRDRPDGQQEPREPEKHGVRADRSAAQARELKASSREQDQQPQDKSETEEPGRDDHGAIIRSLGAAAVLRRAS